MTLPEKFHKYLGKYDESPSRIKKILRKYGHAPEVEAVQKRVVEKAKPKKTTKTKKKSTK
jgi:hypothetical protein|tara:strand:- start:3588 stop:3767 length:180 start_codon:yes stop_codon:yes gene_type:complete